jgi:hypothetical protein
MNMPLELVSLPISVERSALRYSTVPALGITRTLASGAPV